ncbi:hypothetical protein BDR07DRAFT_1381928 [Suillus spraguei]|nr:hypothetical protein BDR07DRAFT_1381928 [Suillus spraguei]
MRSCQPKTIRQLRTWVYNTEDDSCSTNELSRLILRVGESVAIFPDDARAVPNEDGSLPTMSYWYGKVAKIYLKPQGQTHNVWLDIQWYYRRIDLEDIGVYLAESMGEYELVLSDYISLIDMNCIEDHARIISYDEGDLGQHPMLPETPYHRWNIEIKFRASRKDVHIHSMHLSNTQRASQCRCDTCDYKLYCPSISQQYCRKCKQWFNHECLEALERRTDRVPDARLPVEYGDIELEGDFLAMLTMPICRGGQFGVVGSDMKRVLYFTSSMNSSFHFQHWSTRNADTLMKSNGTIEDIDGEYSFKVSGRILQSCPVAAHYRLPLRALNKKFGIYRKIVTHLTDSSLPLAAQLRDTYLSVMDYMHNVRIKFCADALGSPDPLEAGFRSPVLDYYLWLDHKAGGFHDISRTILEEDHKLTGTPIMQRTVGCTSEENLQHLLDQVDASMDSSHLPHETQSLTAGKTMDNVNQQISVTDLKDDIKPPFSAVNTTIKDDIKPPCGAVNPTIDECISQECTSMTVVDSKGMCKIMDDTIGVSDITPPDIKVELGNIGEAIDNCTCVTNVSSYAGLSESVLKPFPLPFNWSYCKRALRTMGIPRTRFDLSRWLIAHIAVRMRELCGLDEDTPLDNVFQHGYECQATYDQYCEVYGMSRFLSAVHAIAQERQSIADFFISAARGPGLSNIRVNCAVQCDSVSQCASEEMFSPCTDNQLHPAICAHAHANEPIAVDHNNDTSSSLSLDIPATTDHVTIERLLPPAIHTNCSEDQSHTLLSNMEPPFTVDCESPCISAADWMRMSVENANCSDIHDDNDTGPLTRLRPRNLKKASPSTGLAQKRRRGNSVSPDNPIDHRPHPGRPVIFAVPQVPSKKKGRAESKLVGYTIDDLVKDSQMDPGIMPPFDSITPS